MAIQHPTISAFSARANKAPHQGMGVSASDHMRGPGFDFIDDSEFINRVGWTETISSVVKWFKDAAREDDKLLVKRTKIGVSLIALNKQCKQSEWKAFQRRVLAQHINKHTFYTAIRLGAEPYVDENGNVDHEAMTEMLRASGFDCELAGTLVGAEILANIRKPKKKHLATDDEIRALERTQAEEAVDPDDPEDYVLEDGELDGMAALNFAADQGGEPTSCTAVVIDEAEDAHANLENIPAHRGGGGDGAANADRPGDRRAGDHAPAVTGAAGGARANPSPAADERTGRGADTAPGAGGFGDATQTKPRQLSLADLYEARDRVRAALKFTDLGTLTEHQRELLLELAATLPDAHVVAEETEASLR